MTETSSLPGPLQDAQADADVLACPSADLLNLIVAFLTPMFLGGSAGDIRMARLAAIELVCAYRACSYVDLLTVVQLVAFSLTTLDSLSLSMTEDISLSMILRLRGNANALNRSGERHRCTLETNQKDLAARQQDDDPATQQGPLPSPMPASAFQDSVPVDKIIPPETQSQAPNSPAPPPAITPQGLPPSSASIFPDAPSQPAGTRPCHLAPSRQVSMRATALGTSASHLVLGANVSPPFVYSMGGRTT